MPSNDKRSNIEKWLSDNKVQDVEVLVGDFAGISRGKKMPVEKFVKAFGSDDLRLPDSIFGMTVDCEFITNDYITDLEEDVFLEPDLATAGLVPWCERVTAYFVCDVRKANGDMLATPPRQVLKNVLALYAERGWRPVVAPEFEFTVLSGDIDQENWLGSPAPARGRSGLLTHDKGVMSLDGVDEFGSMFDSVRRYCGAMGLPIDGLVQEAGVGQFEFNVAHGDPLRMADHSVQFKRAIKWAAAEHDRHVSFMAKPYPDDFGNAMHIHQSVVDAGSGQNVFADGDGNDSELFHSHIAGLQKYEIGRAHV